MKKVLLSALAVLGGVALAKADPALNWLNARVLVRAAAVSDAKLDLMMEGPAAKALFEQMDGTPTPHRGLIIRNSSDNSMYCQYDPQVGEKSYSCELFLIRR